MKNILFLVGVLLLIIQQVHAQSASDKVTPQDIIKYSKNEYGAWLNVTYQTSPQFFQSIYSDCDSGKETIKALCENTVVNGKRHYLLNNVKTLRKYNLTSKQSCGLEIYFYARSGEVLKRVKFPECEYENIVPDSSGYYMFDYIKKNKKQIDKAQ